VTESPYDRRRRRSSARHRGPGGPAASSSSAQDPEPDAREVARAIVLRQLTASAKSRKQLEDKLADRNVPEDVAREVLDRFEEVDLVDDAQFAEFYVRSRAGSRKLSRSAIRRELATRGVTGEIAESALEQRTDEDERADAAELVRRKLPAGAELTDRAERDKAVRRLVGMLGRKGYPPGLAFAVVKEELEARSGAAVQDDETGEEHPETP
jgi:regulatory protein